MTTFTEEDFEKNIGDLDNDPPDPAGDGLTAAELAAIEAASEQEVEQKKEPVAPQTLDGEGIPEELRGKTLEEALGVYEEMKTLSASLASQARQAPPPAPAPAVVPPAPFTTDDIVEEGGKTFNDKLDQFFEAKTAPLVSRLVENQAMVNRNMALSASPVLAKYTATMDRIIAENRLDANALSQGGTWNTLEAMVTKEHVMDIAAARTAAARKPEPEMSAGVSSSPEGGAGVVTLSPAQRAAARGLGVSEKAYAAMVPFVNQG